MRERLPAPSEPEGRPGRKRAEVGRLGRTYRAYAAVAGYTGLFAGLGLVFLYFLLGGLHETWAKALFWAAILIAGVAVLGGAGANYERLFDIFRSRRGVAGMSVALAVALGVVILALTNYISYRRYVSWDVTENARFTLSGQTMNWLERLENGDERLRIVTFIPYDVKSRFTGMPPNARQKVADLLKLYKENCSKIIVEHTLVETQRAAAIEKARALGITEENFPKETVILNYGTKRRDVTLNDIFETRPRAFSGGRARAVFKGEDAITSTIRSLLDEKPKKVYFVVGHGERTPGHDPLDMSTAVEGLKGMNFRIEELDLAEKEGVPEDAGCVVLAGPTRPIPSGTGGFDEIGALEKYLERGGAMLVLVDNNALNKDHHPSGIGRILKPYGVTIRQDRIAVGLEMRGGSLTNGVPNASTEISKPFQRLRAMLYQPCCLETGSAEKGDFSVRRILEGTDRSWGESKFGRQLRFDEGEDLQGPTVLGASVAPAGEGGAERARIVVFSDVDWLSNQFLEDPSIGRFSVNADLFVASTNWMVGRMENIGIPPKEDDLRVADVKPGQRKQLFVGIVLGPVVTMVGLGVYVWRVRSR